MPDRRPRRVRRVCEALSGALLFVALAGAARNAFLVPGPAPSIPARPAPRTPSSDVATPAPTSNPTSTPTPAPSSGGRPADAHAPLPPSTPLRVGIASIKLDAALLALGSDPKGSPELPPYTMPETAAWLRDTPAPGAVGAAVLAGHVDTPTGPAVFWKLSAVPAGSTVDITRIDGSTATFTVDRVKAFPRSTFPADLVYAPTAAAELRIVTCGGAYDRAHHEYSDNVILFAHLTGAH
ncbi:class F sortase [Kitasatospora sp. NPDC056651]|uniref:class F sortase n=1 Tax=Kitasatospora sp. NPDC056651 TaxID=3345892 RepID=UPI00368ED4C0